MGSAAEYTQDPLGFFTRLRADYGDIAHVKFGPAPVIVLYRPAHIRHVMQDRFKNYVRDPFVNDALKFFFEDNVFTADGELWLQQRRIVQPALHRQHVAGLIEMLHRATDDLRARLEAAAVSGEPLRLDREIGATGMRMIGQSMCWAARSAGPTPFWGSA
jgi:cytochrome P450